MQFTFTKGSVLIIFGIPDQFRGLGGAPLKVYTMWYHDNKTSDAALIDATRGTADIILMRSCLVTFLAPSESQHHHLQRAYS